MSIKKQGVKAPKTLINEEFLQFLGEAGLEEVLVKGSVVQLPEVNASYNKETFGSDTVYYRVD